jgi:gliding motility-associated lipoprotein GldH
MRSKIAVLFGFMSLWFFAACDSTRIFEDNQTIENSIWNANKPVVFGVDINDTLTPFNFYFNIRHAEAYPFSNLYVFLNTKFPNGKMARDTVELMLQNADGKWAGSGLGDIWDNQIRFKQNLRFPMRGHYEFSVIQAMQMENLPAIMEVGMRIEKFEKP